MLAYVGVSGVASAAAALGVAAAIRQRSAKRLAAAGLIS
jgi:hypothetical protein